MLRAAMTLLALCALSAHAQELTGSIRSSIEGKVIDDVTGLPVAGMMVYAGGISMTTGDDGRYALRGLIGGGWLLAVHPKNGYADRVRLIRASAGAELKDIDIRLYKEGMVSGRVADRDRNPVEGATVMVMRRGYRNGRPSLGSFHSTRTNPLGEYVVTGLLAGPYII